MPFSFMARGLFLCPLVVENDSVNELVELPDFQSGVLRDIAGSSPV